MDLKTYKKLITLNINAILRPGDIGCLEIIKNGNGQKFFKVVVAGELHKQSNELLKEIIKYIGLQKEAL